MSDAHNSGTRSAKVSSGQDEGLTETTLDRGLFTTLVQGRQVIESRLNILLADL